MTARALAEEREDLASVEERLEDAEASEAAEAVTLEEVLVEMKVTVSDSVEGVELEEEAAVVSVEEEDLVVIHLEEVVLAEIATILVTMMVQELLDTTVVMIPDLEALATTTVAHLVEAEGLLAAMTARGRRSSSR